jgi:TrwC relaxase
VVADVAKLSAGREDYYLRELATDHQQYLSGHGESPGRWYGAGASSLGLQGEASPAGFRRMFEGRDPTTGQLLGRPHGRNAVPAFDVVLRPTKSVSILYGLGRCRSKERSSGLRPARSMDTRWHRDVLFIRYAAVRSAPGTTTDQNLRWSASCGAPRRNRTGDPILTIDAPGVHAAAQYLT